MEEEFDHPSKALLLEYLEMGIYRTTHMESQAGYINESMPYGDAA
ncbi:hypothetical protein ACQKFM_02485 [Paenibacillus xylanexedens]